MWLFAEGKYWKINSYLPPMFPMLKVKPADIYHVAKTTAIEPSSPTSWSTWHATDTDRKMTDKLLPHETLLNWTCFYLEHCSSTCAARLSVEVTLNQGLTHLTSLVKCGTIRHFQQEQLSVQCFMCSETLCAQNVHFSGTTINSHVLSNYTLFTGPCMGFN